MRLLNAKTFKFHDFHRNPPQYAILSHTWGRVEDEVSYRDINDSTATDRKAWHQKVVPCAERAIEDGYDYIWIDTCCVDKSSAVELSEFINSLYRWYREAQICYVVLLDVPVEDTDPQVKTSKFCQSRWFTRGWTLQELLAPKDVCFFNAGWSCLGSRDHLAILIWNITGIEVEYLINNDTIKKASIAVRMYWASRRETKRPEDRSYSLLGLFGVFMWPIYGEGAELAFERLQEQILKKLPGDDSILAWGVSPGLGSNSIIDKLPSSLLAQSPSDFLFSGGIEAAVNDNSLDFNSTTACIVTTATALFQIRAYRCETEPGFGYIRLKCRLRLNYHRDSEYCSIGIPIAWNTKGRSDVCFRVRHPNLFFLQTDETEEQAVDLTVNSCSVMVQPVARSGTFRFQWNPDDVKITAVCPESAWEEGNNAFTFEMGPAVMAVRFSSKLLHKKDYVVLVVSPTREFTKYTRWFVLRDSENTPLEVIVGCQHFHRAVERPPFGCPLTRELSIHVTHNESLARYIFEVLVGELDCPPHPAVKGVDTKTEYLKMKRESVAIDIEVKKLLDNKEALALKMKEMDQEPLPVLKLDPSGGRCLASSKPDADACTPRTSFETPTIPDGEDDDGEGGNVHQVLDEHGLPTGDFHRGGDGRSQRGQDYWGDGDDNNDADEVKDTTALANEADGAQNDVTADNTEDAAEIDEAESTDIGTDVIFQPTYNFAPGFHGIVIRPVRDFKASGKTGTKDIKDTDKCEGPRYQLQVMKWGLVPSWMRRRPDYSSMLKTINCRSDSLASGSGMWAGLRSRKRCIVVASGFYEWLNKGPKERVPHYIRRRDGLPLLMAGLWDRVVFDGDNKDGKDDEDGKDGKDMYTYTIITTDSNSTLRFLHDRMPVLFDYGSKELEAWLDPAREWSADLASQLKPWPVVDTDTSQKPGGLLVDVVSKEVNKTGHSSASFIVPVASADNKSNIANFFKGGPTTPKKRAAGDALSSPAVKRVRDGASPAKTQPTELPQPAQSTSKAFISSTKNNKTPGKAVKAARTASAAGGASGRGSQKITSFFGTKNG
ncbi:hypothetical protein F503_08710 [Ophiostoma piceae UAMH 11346]|uniref:Uncharacterized protein n=1 Tax=Ophiostoma piceae (strain UAMH 11346) TaxID=1262450 RepID=S3BUI6_OPHP1|nr:hypothetical protein F503_08710 [Ophiostoma piceae UAMH 11346]